MNVSNDPELLPARLKSAQSMNAREWKGLTVFGTGCLSSFVISKLTLRIVIGYILIIQSGGAQSE